MAFQCGSRSRYPAESPAASWPNSERRGRDRWTGSANGLQRAKRDLQTAEDRTEAQQKDAAEKAKAAVKQQEQAIVEAEPEGPRDGQSLTELDEEARQAEQQITDAFENVRAVELTVIRDVAPEQARAFVDDVTRPARS